MGLYWTVHFNQVNIYLILFCYSKLNFYSILHKVFVWAVKGPGRAPYLDTEDATMLKQNFIAELLHLLIKALWNKESLQCIIIEP